MLKEFKHIDIRDVPELIRIAEEVQATKLPQVLSRNHEELAVVVPVVSISEPPRPFKGRVAEALAVGYQAVPALQYPMSVEQMVEIASEEHAQAISRDGL